MDDSGYQLAWLQSLSLEGLKVLARVHNLDAEEPLDVPDLIEQLRADEDAEFEEEEDDGFFQAADADDVEIDDDKLTHQQEPAASLCDAAVPEGGATMTDVSDAQAGATGYAANYEEMAPKPSLVVPTIMPSSVGAIAVENHATSAVVPAAAAASAVPAASTDAVVGPAAAAAPARPAAPSDPTVAVTAAEGLIAGVTSASTRGNVGSASRPFVPTKSTKLPTLAQPFSVAEPATPREVGALKALEAAAKKKAADLKLIEASAARKAAAAERRERIAAAFKETKDPNGNAPPTHAASSKPNRGRLIAASEVATR